MVIVWWYEKVNTSILHSNFGKKLSYNIKLCVKLNLIFRANLFVSTISLWDSLNIDWSKTLTLNFFFLNKNVTNRSSTSYLHKVIPCEWWYIVATHVHTYKVCECDRSIYPFWSHCLVHVMHLHRALRNYYPVLLSMWLCTIRNL